MEDFCGFTREQILEASTKNQGRLCVLSRNTRDSSTFDGFDAIEIRNYKRINEEKNGIFILKIISKYLPVG